jgi:hypothetical protein
MPKKDYLIIDRSKWRQGSQASDDAGLTQLLNSKGMMCCLGFRCEQMGIPREELLTETYPEDLSENWDIPGLLAENGCHTFLTCEAIKINDNSKITNEKRETLLTELFKTDNIIVEFKGKYPKF